MTSEETSTQDSGATAGTSAEATSAVAKYRRSPAKSLLAVIAVVSLTLGASLGYGASRLSSSASASTPDDAPIITGVSKANVCQLVSEATQEQLSIREASPVAEEKGGASCYLLMTPDDAAESAGYVVAFYPTSASLQQTVDGTDVIPEKAEPALIEGRAAARQVLYGDVWKAQLTLDAGDGSMLYVERFGPKDSMSDHELRRSVDELAASVVKNRRA
ncbi:hypothetical protein KUM39_18955 [Streptomyces sp. J2-1]|uniref:hypothetical protein n=1 Tax=Streptomyces corallincola TaxID=2851888 RepID=UPI001C388BF8|nr:hypothetical protein [Streptomyces corallincola]MBV2356433.1 hypothetical protein [Streptomyces corallincola]